MPGSGVRVPHNPLVSVCPPSVTEISMKPSEVQIAQNLQALTSPQSRRIITSLNREPLSAAQLAKECKLTPASICVSTIVVWPGTTTFSRLKSLHNFRSSLGTLNENAPSLCRGQTHWQLSSAIHNGKLPNIYRNMCLEAYKPWFSPSKRTTNANEFDI